jgi:ADP-ribosylglycohydrolase
MLVEIAIGDAYGAGFEYVSASFVRQNNNLTGYVQHPRHKIKPGSYTDDTQMSLAIAELIVSGRDWSKENIARFFVEAFKRDPREGYASGFYRFLCEIESAEEFVARIRSDSDKSGAAMRAAPIGVYPTVAEVVEKATRQAQLTHDTVDGIRSAVAAALMSHYFCYKLGPKRELGRFLESQVDGQWSVPWMEKVGPKGWMAVQAAITAIMECDSMSKLLVRCVAFEGDVDTVAAIALGAASCSSEVVQDLPRNLYEGLERGPFGMQFLEALDKTLTKKSGRSVSPDAR